MWQVLRSPFSILDMYLLLCGSSSLHVSLQHMVQMRSQENMLFIPTTEGLKHAITFKWPTRQFKPWCQRTIWSERDHHMQSTHLVWHWFTRSTHQLPSSCKTTEQCMHYNGIHLCMDASAAKQRSWKLKYWHTIKYIKNISSEYIGLYIVLRKIKKKGMFSIMQDSCQAESFVYIDTMD